MPKKNNETKNNKISKKIDNKLEQKNTQAAIKWHQLDQYIGQPVWDTREKKWRILDGYRRSGNTYAVTFSDIADWCSFLDRGLYMEEIKEDAK